MKKTTPFLNTLSRLLDNSIRLPGGFRIGLDGIIGLIPGIGDFVGMLLSSLILIQANQLNVPKSILIKMMINIGIDTVIGTIPVVGDIFDFFWKANQKNMELLLQYQEAPEEVRRKAGIENALMILTILVMIGLLVFFIGWLIASIISWLF